MVVTCGVWRDQIKSVKLCKSKSGMQRHSVYPCEGTVVRGQSKVEKAKYVHSENNLRRTLENISESFKRTNKRFSDETETLRSDLHRLRQSVEKVRQEKMKRITGNYHKKRRPYRAEKFLCDEHIVTLKPFDSSSKIVTQRKSWAKKQCQRRLDPIRLHQNKLKGINDREEISKHGQQPKTLLEETKVEKACLLKLPTIETSLGVNDESFALKKETDGNKIRKNKQKSGIQRHVSVEEKNVSSNPTRYLEVPKVPICSLMDTRVCESWRNSWQSKPHFLPPLDKITEDEVADVESSFPVEFTGTD